MKPPPFEYVAPPSLAEALDVLRTHGSEARVLAGGQSLIPLLNLRLVRPALVVDLGRLRDLAFIERQDGGLRIGALTTQTQIEESALVQTDFPFLLEAIEQIGHPAIRNRGTLGGSLAHADPAAEWPALAIALDATIRSRSAVGERSHAAGTFWTGPLSTALNPDEVITEVFLPGLPPRSGAAFVEFSRRFGDFAVALVVAVIMLDSSGRIADARLVLGGVGATPVRHASAEAALRGNSPRPEVLRHAAQVAASGIQPTGDLHASAEYRRYVVPHLATLALNEAAERALS